MKRELLFFVILLAPSTYAIGQQVDLIQSEIDSLSNEKIALKKRIDSVDEKLRQLKQELLMHQSTTFQIPLKATRKTYLYEKDATYYPKLDTIPKGATLVGLEIKGFYYLTEYNNKRGYVINSDIENPNQEKERLERERISKEKGKERKDKIFSVYGKTNGTRILEKKIWLGMTDKMALESWGRPQDINRTVGSWGVKEQWVYGNAYLYFENGILKSWQD